MSIYKTASGSYRVQVIIGRDAVTGKYIRKGGSHKLKREAVIEERQLLMSVGRASDTSVTFREFTEQVFLPRKEASVRYNTYRVYQTRVKFLNEYLGDMRLASIRFNDIERVVNQVTSTSLAKHYKSLLSTIFNLAMQLEAVTINPARGKMRLPVKRVDRINKGVILTTFDEHRSVYEIARSYSGKNDRMLEIAILLCLGFGLRKGEALALTYGDINFQTKELRVNKTFVSDGVEGAHIVTTPKTVKSNRTIPAMNYVIDRIEELTEGMRSDQPLIQEEGHHLHSNAIGNRLVRYKAQTDLPDITFHSMRHSFATAHINLGTPVADVSAMLGHENIMVTYNAYVRTSLTDIKASVSKANDVLNTELHRIDT